MRFARYDGMIYLTRDTLPDGSMVPWIDVWDAEPERHGAVWTGRQQSLRGYVGPLGVAECLVKYGVAPEDDSHCAIVGPSGKELS